MKYVIAGSLGHISKPLVQKLVAGGHAVTVISSKQDKKAEIESLGAKAAIGSVEDVSFLTQTFTGADAIYTMIPPSYTTPDAKAHIASVGKKYVEAIRKSGVKYVVNLSSIGAHMPKGCGPVSGLFAVEKEFESLADTNVLHLRPASFYYNFLNSVGMVKHAGIIGNNFGEGINLVMVDPNDIADVAADALLKRSFIGKSHLYIVSDERPASEVATILGTAVGKKDLKWVVFTDEQALDGMKKAGVPENLAENLTEMGAALRSGEMTADYFKSKNVVHGKRKLEQYAPVFAEAYKNA